MLFLVILTIVLKLFTILLLVGDIIITLLLPNLGPNVLQMIEGDGYPLERYGNLETEDGYLLEMQRIPYGRNNKNQTNKIPTLIVHGLMASSAEFVEAGPGKGLAYRLADEGYDVWLGNCRGNAWSRKNKKYNPEFNGKQFWNFSYHEMAIYDLPTMIDYVLNKTNQQKLHYVGHSQGTAIFFILMSNKPHYNEKIRMMNALSPIVFMGNVKTPLKKLAPYAKQLETLFWDYFAIYEFPPKSVVYGILARIFCFDGAPTGNLCPFIWFSLVGEDYDQYNKSLSIPLFTYFPSGSSFRQVLHFLQAMQSGHFRQYDYFSAEKNMEHYGQIVPPDYNLTNVIAPVALHYGKNDLLCSIQDTQILLEKLPNVVINNLIQYEYFNHLDFLVSIDINPFLYNYLIDVMKEYNTDV